MLMSTKNLKVFASTDRRWFQNVKYTWAYCGVISDKTKTKMNDGYSFAIFLVAFLRVKIKLWVRLDLDTVSKLFCKP